MKRLLYILCVLNHSMLSNQDMEKPPILSTTDSAGTHYDPDLYSDFENYTYTPNEDEGPCESSIPSFSSFTLMVFYFVVFVLSLLGNSLVVFVVCSMKKGKCSTDVYLMNLALADLLFCLTLPFWGVDTHLGWLHGDFLCKLLSCLRELSVYGGVFLLACISVDRYLAIVRATQVLTSRRLLVGVACGVVWLLAGCLSLPVAVRRESIYVPSLDKFVCHENLTGESASHWLLSVRVMRHTLGFFLPLAVMSVCYGWTALTLFHARNQQKQKAMRVILAVVLAFVLCWLPHNVAVLMDTLVRGGSLKVESCQTQYRVETTLYVTEILAYTHCAINPVLYAFVGQKFRNQLLVALHRRGLISKTVQLALRKGSTFSLGSNWSRNTSVSV